MGESGTQRYFFVHLQKTGGTALYMRLRDHFGPRAVFPTPDEQGDVRSSIDVEFLLDRLRAHGEEVQVITGHFPLCTAEVMGMPLTTFTVLRDPVERTLSLLRRRKSVEERFHDLDLEEIYEDSQLRNIIRNHMVKMLSLTPDEMKSVPLVVPIEFDDDRLERAKRNLEERIDVFGLQEHFDEFCSDLASRFDWDLGAPRFANRTEPRPVSDELRERIASDNRMDVELYDFAARVWDERRRQTAKH